MRAQTGATMASGANSYATTGFNPCGPATNTFAAHEDTAVVAMKPKTQKAFFRSLKISMALCVFACISTFSAFAQLNPSDGRLILYKTNRTQEKYVLCMNFSTPENDRGSLVVIGDTFAVKSKASVCWVTMTNAYILQTKFGKDNSNDVSQIKMSSDSYMLPFSNNVKLIYNNSVVELSKAKIPNNEGGSDVKVYEGGDALEQLKKMGLKSPEDMK